LTRDGRLATLDRSEGIGMGEIDDRTVAGLKATLVRAFEQGDAALAAALYEPGARLLPPGAPVITGADAVRDFFQRRFDAGSDGGVLETVRIDEYADVAVEEGRYGRRAGERLLDSGKYLAVFRRQPGGAWRWAIDMWNSDAG
jgi:ketosteroid isomerase-like protein